MNYFSQVDGRPQWDSYSSSHLSVDNHPFCVLKEESQCLDHKPELQMV